MLAPTSHCTKKICGVFDIACDSCDDILPDRDRNSAIACNKTPGRLQPNDIAKLGRAGNASRSLRCFIRMIDRKSNLRDGLTTSVPIAATDRPRAVATAEPELLPDVEELDNRSPESDHPSDSSRQ